ncbi:MAG: GLUG motif-containing protein [Planctomycetota bacterium]
MTDINLSGRVYRTAVIARDIDNSNYGLFDGPPFKGIFDGNGFNITNLLIKPFANRSFLGLFGEIEGEWSIVKNLGINNYTIISEKNTSNVGSITGFNLGGVVRNCYSEGSIRRDSSWEIGGLIGRNRGTVEHCSSVGSISGGLAVGGLIGFNEGEIIDCSSIGMVTGDSSHGVGGLVGHNDGIIEQSSSTAQVSGSSEVGGLVGKNDEGSLIDCHSNGSVTGKGGVGGLLGATRNGGNIIDCYSTGVISGNGIVGGLIGEVDKSNVIGCYATGSAIAKGDYVGGLIGRVRSHTPISNISNCYATGSVKGKELIGGLIGICDDDVINCYAAGQVKGTMYIGGLVGYMSGSLKNCYSTGSVTGSERVGGLLGYCRSNAISCFWDVESSGIGMPDDNNFDAIGKMTLQMQTQSTFTETQRDIGGWDFVGETINGTDDIWFMRDGIEYPRLFDLNRKPVADAGSAQIVHVWIDEVAEVRLDGTGSYDEDGDALEYYWYDDADELIATGVEPNVLFGVGEYEVTLVVNDGIEDSEPNACVVTVIEALEAEAKLMPQSLNRKSNRPHVIGRLELMGYDAADLDPDESMVLMPGNIAAERVEILPGKKKGDSIKLMGFFDHALVMEAIAEDGDVEVTLAAKLLSGQWMFGTDIVTVK